MYPPVQEEGLSNNHSLGCGEVDEALTIFVRFLMKGVTSYRRAIDFLLSHLSIEVSSDFLDIVAFKRDIEPVLFFIISYFLESVHTDYTVIMEPPTYSDEAYSGIHRLPSNHQVSKFTTNNKSHTKLVCVLITTLEYSVVLLLDNTLACPSYFLNANYVQFVKTYLILKQFQWSRSVKEQSVPTFYVNVLTMDTKSFPWETDQF